MDGDASSFVGYYISLTCDNDSIYEGEVLDIDITSQLITLNHAHQLLPDGNAVKFPQITLTGNHIKSLKIIRERINVIPFTKEEKDNAIIKEFCQNNLYNSSEFPLTINKLKNDNLLTDEVREKNDKWMMVENMTSENVNPLSTLKGLHIRSEIDFQSCISKTKKKNLCFSAEADKLARYPDFDFEENLAKFDKQAIFERMYTDRELDPGISGCNKMRPQDNILEREPVSLRQIKVPLEHAGKEYCTEDGFIVPAITLALKIKLFSAAEKAGLSLPQLVENAGICTCQMALQLVGGSLRINPENDHQRPEIVVSSLSKLAWFDEWPS